MINIEEIRNWVTFAADMCVLGITFYTAYKTFICTRIDLLSFSGSHDTKEGEMYSIVISNRRIMPLAISEVNLIVDGTYLLPLMNNREPIIIEGFGTYTISSKRFGYLEPDIGIFGSNVVVEITIEQRKRVYLRLHKGRKFYTKKKISQLERVEMITNIINGKIIPKHAKYVIVVRYENQSENVIGFIFESGVMTEAILGYNGLPKEVTYDIKKLEEYLYEWLDKYNVEFRIKYLDTYIPIDNDKICDDEDGKELVLPEAHDFVISNDMRI